MKQTFRYDLYMLLITLHERVMATAYGSEPIRIKGPQIWELLHNSNKASKKLEQF